MKKKHKITVRAADVKVATGHSNHISGTGAHGDKRTKRVRTRAAKNREAMKGY